MVYKQDTRTPMSLWFNPATFWANMFLYYFLVRACSKSYSEKATRVYKYITSSRFIDDICARNNNNEFPKSFKFIYSGELELKLEHSGTHEIVLDLDIKIEDEIFVYKFFDKRDKF